MRTILPCYVKFKYCHYRPTWDTMLFWDVLFIWFSSFCINVVTLYVMPHFVPNQFMLDKHRDKGKEEWEIYSWCVRDAMLKSGQFEDSDLSYREKMQFENYMNKFAETFEFRGRTYPADLKEGI